jgi:protein-disulfide isomerase
MGDTRLGDEEHGIGPEDAPLVLVEYGDLACPETRRAAAVVSRIQDRWRGQARFVWRHFPRAHLHPNALSAALAAEAAARQGAFWEMLATLLHDQDNLTPDDLESHAEGLGLDVGRFLRAMESPTLRQRVERDRLAGQRQGVQRTPTFFVNGVRFDGPAEHLPALVERLLTGGEAGAGAPAAD